MLTFGGDDISGLSSSGYIRINGIEWLKTWTDTYRGFNLIELNVENCASNNIRHFDTFASTSYANDLVTYINSFHQPTVLIGVTVDEASDSLTTEAKNTLKGVGVDMTKLTYRDKAIFVTQIGNPSASFVKIAPAGGNNLRSSVAVRCTYELNVINIASRWPAVY
jgi:Interleukin-like EMT inducer